MKQYDFIIIGAGVSGALAASALAKSGYHILMLEAGEDYKSRQHYLDRYYKANLSIRDLPETPYPIHPEAPFPQLTGDDDYIVQVGPSHERFQTTYLRILGGTTLHWLGTALRLHPHDFKLKSRYGIGRDWPISYEELSPWYDLAEKELGVSGSSDDFPEFNRHAAFPMPKLPLSMAGQYIKKTCDAMPVDGKQIHVSSTPQARNSQNGYQDRPACVGNHSCIPICPIQAKYDALVHLKKARTLGVEIRTQAVVDKIHVGKNGQISHVTYLNWDGTQQQVSAKRFLLAAHGIESAKLLLHSRTNVLPNGVANTSDQVGRNLMDHPMQMSYAKSNIPIYPMRSPFSTSGIESLVDGAFRKDRAAFRIQISDTAWSWPKGSPHSEAEKLIQAGYFGKTLNQKLLDEVAPQFALNSLCEMLPSAGNRVTLSEQKDGLGIAKPFISFKLDDYALAGLHRARQLHQEMLVQADAHDIHHYPDEKWLGSGHIIGTTIMGSHPNTAVVDKNLRSHDHPNLYILGSSTFASSGCANPTLTIAALTLRLASHLNQDLQ